MIAYRVTLNGKQLCLAGAEDLNVLTAIVTAVGPLGKLTTPRPDQYPEIGITVGGLTARDSAQPDEHLRWTGHTPLAIGDRIEIEILHAESTDPAHSRQPAPSASGSET